MQKLRPCPLASALLTLAVLSGAWDTDGEELFFDTVEVSVVNVEVLVTDADGLPVSGLSREDFLVLENGEPVELTNFLAVEQGSLVALPGQELEAPTLPPEATRRLQVVVVVDNRSLSPQNRNLILPELREYLTEQLDARDRAMIVTLGDTAEVRVPFTNDTEELAAGIDALEKEVGMGIQLQAEYRMFMDRLQKAPTAARGQGPGESQGQFEMSVFEAQRTAQEIPVRAERRYRQAVATTRLLMAFTDSLAGLPGRKAVLYVSDGMPLRASDSLVEAWMAKYDAWIAQNNLEELYREVSSLTSLEFDATQAFQVLVEHASSNRVAFYPISAGGMISRAQVSAEFGGAGTTSGTGPMSLGVVTIESQSREGSLLSMAEGTGGVAFTNTREVGTLLARMSTDSHTYYSLGYRPPNPGSDKFRRIQVKLAGDSRGLEIRHLKGYREKDPLENLQALTLSALHHGLTENPLEIALDPQETVETGKNKYRVSLLVKIPFKNLLLFPQEDTHTGRVTLFVAAGDAEGRTSPIQRIELPIKIPNDNLFEALEQLATYPMELEMRGGQQLVAVGARDNLGQVDSTARVRIHVD